MRNTVFIFSLLAITFLTSCAIGTVTSTETVKSIASPTINVSVVPASTNTLTAKEILSLYPTLIPTPTFIPAPIERLDGDNISGKYQFVLNEGRGCILAVVLEPTDEIGFELLCNRGAPSYNSGYAKGKTLIVNNIAVYSPKFFPDKDQQCSIVFQFEENKVIVTQLGESFECGFGHAVYASGTYELIDNKPPQLGCLHPPDYCLTQTP